MVQKYFSFTNECKSIVHCWYIIPNIEHYCEMLQINCFEQTFFALIYSNPLQERTTASGLNASLLHLNQVPWQCYTFTMVYYSK